MLAGMCGEKERNIPYLLSTNSSERLNLSRKPPVSSYKYIFRCNPYPALITVKGENWKHFP